MEHKTLSNLEYPGCIVITAVFPAVLPLQVKGDYGLRFIEFDIRYLNVCGPKSKSRQEQKCGKKSFHHSFLKDCDGLSRAVFIPWKQMVNIESSNVATPAQRKVQGLKAILKVKPANHSLAKNQAAGQAMRLAMMTKSR